MRGVVYRTLAAHLSEQVGLTHARARTGVVILIQRFGRYFHRRFLDGGYAIERERLRVSRVTSPRHATLEVRCSGEWIGRHRERHSLWVRDLEPSYLT